MRILILSDIHSNAVALAAVLAAAGSYDQLWNLGDTIGYGPQPNECVELMRAHATVMIAGNHDLACLGRVDLRDFNPDARSANIWNGEQLTPDARALLESLPPLQAIDECAMVAHGSPGNPIWEYLLTRAQALENFELFEQQVCFIGHSHVPLIFRLSAEGRLDGPTSPDAGRSLLLEPGMRYLINPGSVGQPRNQDPRAAYAIFDTESRIVQFERITYDVEETQRQMRAVRLPEPLALRLQYGM
ncbi:MAG TPA: metallophosphoesterase family protein [Roseiflexaceae bacterium]|nr:metallophosphoesterase family protein [Roseiflexaceae bacterium]HMP39030.1 metallophosphoesterase family protein [Roseiflexaceae bacterium]